MAAAAMRNGGGKWINGIFVPDTNTATGAMPQAPGLPMYNTGSLSQQEQQGIGMLFNPNFNTNEVDTMAAERAVGGGFGGSGFALAGQTRLRDSEKISRLKLGSEMLQPYLSREHESRINASNNAAAAARQAEEGAQALQRLQLSEAGQSQRLSQTEKAELEQLVLKGQQAMQLQALTEAGSTARSNENNRTTIASKLLEGYSSGSGSGDGRIAPRGTNNIGTGNSGVGSVGLQPVAGYSGGVPYYNQGSRVGTTGGSNQIDTILRSYGLV